jgi:hypothetical protein
LGVSDRYRARWVSATRRDCDRRYFLR